MVEAREKPIVRRNVVFLRYAIEECSTEKGIVETRRNSNVNYTDRSRTLRNHVWCSGGLKRARKSEFNNAHQPWHSKLSIDTLTMISMTLFHEKTFGLVVSLILRERTSIFTVLDEGCTRVMTHPCVTKRHAGTVFRRNVTDDSRHPRKKTCYFYSYRYHPLNERRGNHLNERKSILPRMWVVRYQIRTEFSDQSLSKKESFLITLRYWTYRCQKANDVKARRKCNWNPELGDENTAGTQHCTN